mmetsp:Transcript_9025/g.12409  ORF Transcript_9025/g.12409 Transcript_9025/m.12409 type:complete len:142 (-) Transcript_9025:28-453(-)
MVLLDEKQRIGVLLTGFGLFFTFFGVLLLFDRGLLAIGNILFLSGIGLVIGVRKTAVFFFQRRKLKGTSCFLGGLFLVLIGWPFIGMCVETFGFINLFHDFFPYVFSFLLRLPFIGPFLRLPGIKQVVDQIVNAGTLPVFQ